MPSWSRIASLISVRYRFNTPITSEGSRPSAKLVKPRRSLNSTVAVSSSPPSRTSSSESARSSTWATTESGTKRENRSRVCVRSTEAVIQCTASAPTSASPSPISGTTTGRISPFPNANWAMPA